MGPQGLFDEARLMVQALKRWGETTHDGVALTAPMRAVLELLFSGGTATVPKLARARGVSRQHIQQQIDRLLARGFVERQRNPAHKRSSLIELTDKGRALVENMRAEERNAIERIQAGVSDRAVEEATTVLTAWRTALQRDTERRAAHL